MSEQTVVEAPAVESAAPAAEQAVPETPVVETEQPVEQPAPMSRREARQAAREAARQAFTKGPATTEASAADPAAEQPREPIADATGRLHDPATGKFIEKQGQDTAADGRSETPNPEAAATPPTGETTTDAAAATPQPIRVELPQDHPLRAQGIDAITASTPQEERAIRAMLNGTYTRRQEVESLRAEIARLREEQMRREASDTASQKWKQTPEYQQAVEQYQSILETVGQDAASRYWAGMEESFKQLADAEYIQRQQAYEAQQAEQAVAHWRQEAWANAGRLPEQIRSLPEFSRYFDEAFALFDAGLARGLYADAQSPEQLHQEFARVFAAHLMLQPSVKAANAAIAEQERRRSAEAKARADAEAAAAKRAEEERKRIADEAVEQYRRSLAEKRQATPPNPLAQVHNAVRTDRTSISSEPEQPDLSNLTPQQMKRTLREQTREEARARFSRP